MSLIKREHRQSCPVEPVWSQDLIDAAFSDTFGNVFGTDGVLDRGRRIQVTRVEEYLEDATCVQRAELPGTDPENDVATGVPAPEPDVAPVTTGSPIMGS